jgi:hypothetical protein
MASFWSEYLKNKMLDHYRGVAAFSAPSTTWLALMIAKPTPAGGGSPAAIPRLSVVNSSVQWNAASAGLTTNKNNLNFVTSASSDFGTIIGIAEYDASTGGNLLTYGDLNSPKTILAGMNFDVSAGAGIFSVIDDAAPPL